jgi:hypothetical protein
MFNDKYGLTDAVLQGRKTMTRRMVSAPEYWHGVWVWGFSFDEHSHSLLLYDADERPMEDPDTGECAYIKPRYKIGEVVAVAQSYQTILDTVFGDDQQWKYGYKREVEESYEKMWEDIKGRTNKMFVLADLMPHQIRITNIKVERLQDISDEDCLREGLIKRTDGFIPEEYFYTYCGADVDFAYVKTAFEDLIDKVSGKGTWESNPWVFAYSFELVK